MSAKAHNPTPLEPPTKEMHAYWEALGRFVHHFAQVEKLLAVFLWKKAGVSIEIGRAVFSGVRATEATGHINRILEVAPISKSDKIDIDAVFTQLGHINALRNSILHHGTVFSEGAEFATSNEIIALTPSRVKTWPVSVAILHQMTADLEKISMHLLHHHWGGGTLPEEVIGRALGSALRSPWQYKPPQQAGGRQKPLDRSQGQPPQPKPSGR